MVEYNHTIFKNVHMKIYIVVFGEGSVITDPRMWIFWKCSLINTSLGWMVDMVLASGFACSCPIITKNIYINKAYRVGSHPELFVVTFPCLFRANSNTNVNLSGPPFWQQLAIPDYCRPRQDVWRRPSQRIKKTESWDRDIGDMTD